MAASTEETLKSAEEWLLIKEFKGVKILDPDGWDRRGGYFEASWNEKITYNEFCNRLAVSTCQYPANFFKQYMNKQ